MVRKIYCDILCASDIKFLLETTYFNLILVHFEKNKPLQNFMDWKKKIYSPLKYAMNYSRQQSINDAIKMQYNLIVRKRWFCGISAKLSNVYYITEKYWKILFCLIIFLLNIIAF